MEHFENTPENRVSNNSNIKTKNKRPRVFIADDHTPMLETIERILRPHFEVIGTAQDGETALEMIKRLRPDCAVLDIEMPFKTGIDVAADLKTNEPEIKVVIISAHHDDSYTQAARNAGALAFIPKIRLADELVAAIKNVHAENGFHLTQRPGQ